MLWDFVARADHANPSTPARVADADANVADDEADLTTDGWRRPPLNATRADSTFSSLPAEAAFSKSRAAPVST
jgi:hypothetical protein